MKAPALPSFHDESKANLFPFAAVCAAWIAPMLRFWLHAWDVAPNAIAFAIAAAVVIGLWWLPPSYYRSRSFEHGRLYPLLGVRLFRALAPNGDLVNRWRRRHDRAFRVIANPTEADTYVARTIAGEKTHLVSFAIGIASSLHAWRIGWMGWALYIAIANVIFNVYPILLQRYTRARITRLRVRRP